MAAWTRAQVRALHHALEGRQLRPAARKHDALRAQDEAQAPRLRALARCSAALQPLVGLLHLRECGAAWVWGKVAVMGTDGGRWQ